VLVEVLLPHSMGTYDVRERHGDNGVMAAICLRTGRVSSGLVPILRSGLRSQPEHPRSLQIVCATPIRQSGPRRIGQTMQEL
jgi:hypothetical protein